MLADVQPTPSGEEREAILAALETAVAEPEDGWAAAALLEGVEDADLEP